MTRKALYEGGKNGNLIRATLQASPAGRPVYERIGLEITSDMRLFTLRR